MSKPIKDRFTKLPISRQEKYTLRMKAKGKCSKCPKPILKWGLCAEHVLKNFHQRRQREGCVKKYTSPTAALEKMEK